MVGVDLVDVETGEMLSYEFMSRYLEKSGFLPAVALAIYKGRV